MTPCPAGCRCAECVYEFEERAAILEFDGGLTRDEAEREARRQLAAARTEGE